MSADLSAAEVLAIENQLTEGSRLFDGRRRNGKGVNRYAELFADPKTYEQVIIALNGGASKNAIFRLFLNEGIFEGKASRTAFIRALSRAIERRANPQRKIKVKFGGDKQSKSSDDLHATPVTETGHQRFESALLRKREEEKIDLSDLPDYIQGAFENSRRNGTVIEDADKNRRLVEEWQLKNKQ